MKTNKPTYISLFSSAGVGCYGFKLENFDCVATNELITRRLDIQRYNHKCKFESGYICGDITDNSTKDILYSQIDLWKKKENVSRIDVIVATPPCQGMSVANHKKSTNEIVRNSLVIESIKIIKQVNPRFFIFENVAAFMKTICTDIDGMHNNDPRIVKNTTPIKKLSFEEAERLAYFGAKILHPFCIAPARQKDIPVRLLSSIEPQAEGTLISKSQDDRILKAIAAKDSIFYLKFESNHALRPYLFTSKVFDTFARYQTSLCLLTSSSTDISIATDNNEALPRIIRELSKYANVTVEDHMSIISIVGNMKWQYTGFEAKIMEALKDIPLRMISYGSTNNDVSVVVKTSDKKKALQALSNSLFEDKMLV